MTDAQRGAGGCRYLLEGWGVAASGSRWYLCERCLLGDASACTRLRGYVVVIHTVRGFSRTTSCLRYLVSYLKLPNTRKA